METIESYLFYYVLVSTPKYTRNYLVNTDEFLLVEILPLVRTSPKLGLGQFIAALHSLAKKGITLKLEHSNPCRCELKQE